MTHHRRLRTTPLFSFLAVALLLVPAVAEAQRTAKPCPPRTPLDGHNGQATGCDGGCPHVHAGRKRGGRGRPRC